ncbi:MAG TPA: response regulator transcription factor [Candidatus Dormibacteraeota bacterium]
MAAALKIVIADDQALVRAGFRMILESQPDLEVVAEAANGEEAVAATRRHRPDVVLMDVRMPRLNGIEATRRIAAAAAGTPKVLILTTFDLDEYVFEAIRAGADGFLLKDVKPEHLIAAVRQVSDGDALLAPSITRRLIERFARPAPAAANVTLLASLTARELEVLGLMARGLTNAEIASELHLSESTVKTHAARLFSKLDLRDRAQAVVFAYEAGVVAARQPSP